MQYNLSFVTPMTNRPPSSLLDFQFAEEFEQTLHTALDSVSLTVFLCGKALAKSRAKDLRLYLKEKLENEITSCRVKLGEHRQLMKRYRNAAGNRAFNLADHELVIAKQIDLLVIFPCSPGSFAELGMFSVEASIAAKMVVFLDARFRKSRSYVVEGPVAAAKRRNSIIYVMKYSDREKIFKKVLDVVLKIRANKGKAKLLS